MRRCSRNFIFLDSDDEDGGEAVAATNPVPRHLTRRNESSGQPNHPRFSGGPGGEGRAEDERAEASRAHKNTSSRGTSLPSGPKASAHLDSAPPWTALQLGSELSPEVVGEAADEGMHDGFGNSTMLVPQCKRQCLALRTASPDYDVCETDVGQSVCEGIGTEKAALEVAAVVEGVDAIVAGDPQPRTGGGENELDQIQLPRAASCKRARETSVHPLREGSRAAVGTTLSCAADGQSGEGNGGNCGNDDSDDVLPRWKEVMHGGRSARPAFPAAVAAAVPDGAAMPGGSGDGGYTLRARRGKAFASSRDEASSGNGCVTVDADVMAAAAPMPPHISSGEGSRRECKQHQEEEGGQAVQEQEEAATPWCSTRQQAACMQREMEQQVLGVPSRVRRGLQVTESLGPKYATTDDEDKVEGKEEQRVVGDSRGVRRAGDNNGWRKHRAAKRGGQVTNRQGSKDEEEVEEDMGDDDGSGAIGNDSSNGEEESDYIPRQRRSRRSAFPATANKATKTAKQIRNSPPTQQTRSKVKRRSSKTPPGKEQRLEDSDDEDELPVKKRACTFKAAAHRLTGTDKSGKEEGSHGSGGGNYGHRKRGGRLCQASKAAAWPEPDDDMLQDALQDDYMDMEDRVLEPDLKPAKARLSAYMSPDAAAAGANRNGDGGSQPRRRRPVKQRKAITLTELRERARQKLDGTFGVEGGANDGDEVEEEEQLCGRRRQRLQHPGLQDDCDAELAAHAMFDADEAALEDEIEPRTGCNPHRRPAIEEDDDDSFINDGEIEVGEASSEEEEEVEEVDEEPRMRGSGGCAAVRSFVGLRSPPVAAQVYTDQVENFKSWVTPMICRLLQLRLVAEDEYELEQEQMNQQARASRFENALIAARKRTMSYSWVHAVTKLGLDRVLERYPILLIDDMAPGQFYGVAGTRAVQEEIARETQMPGRSQPYKIRRCALDDYDLDGLDDEDVPRCDICHAHRTHRLHTLSLQGDPADVNGDSDDSGAAGPLKASEDEEKKGETREFLAGGMCCDRIVLYHALCHFKRWLLASLKKRLKDLLRNHLRRRAPDGMWPDEVRSEVMVQMLRNSDKYLTDMYGRCKELLDAEQKLYITQNSRGKEGRFMPGRLVAEVMSDVHQSIDGYESDISGIPEEDGEGEDSGDPNSGDDVISGGGGGGDDGDDSDGGDTDGGDGDGGGSGQVDRHDARRIPESQRRQQRRMVLEDGDEEDGNIQDKSGSGASAPISANRAFDR
ncbi:hypothetical protein Vretifemale_19665, partial [Volvox reticuliferus]